MYSHSTRIAPDHIHSLKEHEVFVFGSNIEGHHGGGAAGYTRGKAKGIEEGDAAGKAEMKAELLGEMGEECTGCTAVEVTDGTTTVTLYKPEKVKYIKK